MSHDGKRVQRFEADDPLKLRENIERLVLEIPPHERHQDDAANVDDDGVFADDEAGFTDEYDDDESGEDGDEDDTAAHDDL